MEQVFINLFMNAIQAMPPGGKLTIKTSARRFGDVPHSSEQTPVRFDPEDTVVITEVQDTGVGIPEEKLPNIFKPFFTTKPAGVGTGLGLPVTKQIIDLHGGTIDIKSARDAGARVTLALKAENGESHEKETNPVGG
jgi:signal transduction histidine kinase